MTTERAAITHHVDLADVQPGDVLCQIGRGTAAPVHNHVKVKRLTKLYIVTEYTNKYGTHENRFRRDDGRSVPYSDYGGSSVHTECKRPTKLKRTAEQKSAILRVLLDRFDDIWHDLRDGKLTGGLDEAVRLGIEANKESPVRWLIQMPEGYRDLFRGKLMPSDREWNFPK